MVWGDLDCLDVLQKITLVHYIAGIMPIEPDEQEAASILEAFLVKFVCPKGWR